MGPHKAIKKARSHSAKIMISALIKPVKYKGRTFQPPDSAASQRFSSAPPVRPGRVRATHTHERSRIIRLMIRAGRDKKPDQSESASLDRFHKPFTSWLATALPWVWALRCSLLIPSKVVPKALAMALS